MNDGERRNCEFQRRAMDESSFFGFLFRALYKADNSNMARVAKGFPEEAKAVYRWKTEDGYSTSIMAEYKELEP